MMPIGQCKGPGCHQTHVPEEHTQVHHPEHGEKAAFLLRLLICCVLFCFVLCFFLVFCASVLFPHSKVCVASARTPYSAHPSMCMVPPPRGLLPSMACLPLTFWLLRLMCVFGWIRVYLCVFGFFSGPLRCFCSQVSRADQQYVSRLWPRAEARIVADGRVHEKEVVIRGEQETCWTWALPHVPVGPVVRPALLLGNWSMIWIPVSPPTHTLRAVSECSLWMVLLIEC